MAKPNPFRSKELTQHLRRIALEAESIEDDGAVITKAQRLAEILWQRALGYEEIDPDHPSQRIKHKPEAWAIERIYDRLEGKTPTAMPDEGSTHSVAAKVSELAKGRLNELAHAAVQAEKPKTEPGAQ